MLRKITVLTVAFIIAANTIALTAFAKPAAPTPPPKPQSSGDQPPGEEPTPPPQPSEPDGQKKGEEPTPEPKPSPTPEPKQQSTPEPTAAPPTSIPDSPPPNDDKPSGATINLNTSLWAVEALQKAGGMNLIPPSLANADLTRPITRQEFAAVAVLVFENLTDATIIPAAVNPFRDTSDSYVLKAYNVGITSGSNAEGTEFSPNAILSREQMATMLTRVIKACTIPDWTIETDMKYSLDFTAVSVFSDDGNISTWAKPSVYFMASYGLIMGDNNMFRPRPTNPSEEALNYGCATREQAIAIAVRMVENLKGGYIYYTVDESFTPPPAPPSAQPTAQPTAPPQPSAPPQESQPPRGETPPANDSSANMVEFVVPGTYFMESSREESMEYAKKIGVEIIPNRDGSYTYRMTRQMQQILIDEQKGILNENLSRMVISSEYPEIADILYNEDYSVITFQCICDLEDFEPMTIYAFLTVSMTAPIYQVYQGRGAAARTQINIVDVLTGWVYGTYTSPDDFLGIFD